MAMAADTLSQRQKDALYQILQYMFEKYMKDITPILSEFSSNKDLILLIARANCSNIIYIDPEQLRGLKFIRLDGEKLPEPFRFQNYQGKNHLIHKTSDYWILLGVEDVISKIMSPAWNILSKLKKTNLYNMVKSHANVDSPKEVLIMNYTRFRSYTIIRHHEVPFDYNIFLKTIYRTETAVKAEEAEEETFGSVFATEMVEDAKRHAQTIIQDAHIRATQIYDSAIGELEKKKMALETEIATLQYEKNRLKLEVALLAKPTQVAATLEVLQFQSPLSSTTPTQDIITPKSRKSSPLLAMLNVGDKQEFAEQLDLSAKEHYLSFEGLNINAQEFQFSAHK